MRDRISARKKKVGNPRRASFCARMKGMKKKLTFQSTTKNKSGAAK